MISGTFLNINHLTCTLISGEVLFKEIAFDLNPTETLLIEGGSGMGKTTLLMGIKGIFSPHKIFTGSITYNSLPMDGQHEREVGLILQNPHSQMISTLVHEELISGCPDLHGETVSLFCRDVTSFDGQMDASEAMEMKGGSLLPQEKEAVCFFQETVSRLGIGHLLNRSVRHLSAGEKHLVAIGAAAMMRSRLLLMDEPFLYLDQANIRRLLSYIGYLKERGIAQIITSHPGVVDHSHFDHTLSIAKPPRFQHSESFKGNELGTTDLAGISKSAITLDRVSYAHENGGPIVEELSLHIPSGTELWIAGENGSGKTTLLGLLSKARVPDEGSVSHTKMDLQTKGEHLEQKAVGAMGEDIMERQGQRGKKSLNSLLTLLMITQNPDRFFFSPQIFHEMKSALLGKKGADHPLTRAQHRQIEAVLDRVGLKGKETATPFSLSFGEKIRLAAAQAWLLRPDFIFVDDILGFLDPEERIFLIDFLRRCKDSLGCGLIFTSSRGVYRENETVPLISLERIHTWESSRINEHDLTSVTPNHENSVSDSTVKAHGCCPAPPDHENDIGVFTIKQGHSTISRSEKKKTTMRQSRPLWKRILRWLRLPALEYMVGNSWLHRASPMVKMALAILFWAAIYKTADPWFPAIGALLVLYYLSGGMGIRRFMSDSLFFLFQTALFTLFLPLFRWHLQAAGEGFLAGVRVWFFFIPVIVMMRTTTVAQWLESFGRLISRRKKRAVGIAMGLLPVLMGDARELLHAQKHKGYLPNRRDLLNPRRFFYGLKSIFIPLLIMMEESAELAGLAVKLRGHDE